MSLSEYSEWLLEIGMGWLGYTEQEVDNMNLVALHIAYEGKLKMLEACGFIKLKKADEAPSAKHTKLDSVEAFDALFGD